MFLDVNALRESERERECLYRRSAPVLGSVHKYSQTAHCGWHRPQPAPRQSLQGGVDHGELPRSYDPVPWTLLSLV